MKMLRYKPTAVFFILSMALISTLAYAGEFISQTREVSGFDKIEVNGAYDLYITQGQEYSLRIEAEPEIQEKIKTEVKDGQLRITHKKHKIQIGIFKSKARKIYVTLPELKELCINGSSDVIGQNKFKAGNLSLVVNGSGDIDLELEASDVSTSIRGSGDIKLKGSADNFDISIAGSGDVSAYDLASQKTTVNIKGAGDCKVNAGQELTVNISGSGDVSYQGNPKVVMKNVSGVGSIHKN